MSCPVRPRPAGLARASLVLAALAAAAAVAPAPARSVDRCGWSGYSYAGAQSPDVGFGVSARITLRRAPSVESGHVAAWVGVGGSGLGPGGADEWVQVGVSGFEDGRSELYYEVMRPGGAARYVPLGGVRPGDAHDLAVVERPAQPNSWKVLVDGRQVASVRLPGSHGAWRPVATAETWDGGQPACNRFVYEFANVAVVDTRGGAWRPFPLSQLVRDPGYSVRAYRSGFVSSAAA